MTPAAIIFDVDGTLAETERDGHRVAFNQTFQAAGLDWHWSVETYGQLLAVAGGKERMRHFIEVYCPPLPEGLDWQAALPDWHRAKTLRYGELLRQGAVSLRPGVRRLVAAARAAGVRLAIATTSHYDNAIALLQHTLGPSSPDWFEVIAAGDIVPHKKPAPDIYQYVLDRMALSPHQALVIEDTDQGLTAAQGAGLRTVITVNDYTRHQDFSQAQLVLSHLGEPEQPFEVLAGSAQGDRYFTLALATALLR
jgi:HAD superfamily hydrolase (TIGR01509 family)